MESVYIETTIVSYTWNCKHLANAQIMRSVALVCHARGFSMPVICTPEELMGD